MSYLQIKKKLLDTCSSILNEDEMRRKIYSARRERGETLDVFASRLLNLCNALVQLNPLIKLIKEIILIDAFKGCIPEYARNFINGRKFMEYWQSTVICAALNPRIGLRDENILKEENSTVQMRRM